MEMLALVLGILGNILSVMVLAAPLSTFWKIFKRGSIESFSSLPYICTLLSNMLWLYYGIIQTGAILILTIAAAACAFELFYLTMYILYSTKVERVSTARHLAIILVMFSIFLGCTVKLTNGSLRIKIVGIMCSINSVFVYASPLSIVVSENLESFFNALGKYTLIADKGPALFTFFSVINSGPTDIVLVKQRLVIATRSVQYMPLLLSLSLFVCGGVWFAYAIVARDVFIGISNGTGFFLGCTQLVLYSCYYNYDRKRKPPLDSADKTKVQVQDIPLNGDGGLPAQIIA